MKLKKKMIGLMNWKKRKILLIVMMVLRIKFINCINKLKVSWMLLRKIIQILKMIKLKKILLFKMKIWII